MAPRHSKKIRITRDMFIALVGAVGLVHETFFAKEPREVLVWLFGGMVLGIPFLHQGDKEKSTSEIESEDK